MNFPRDYEARVYAGVLGKMIGVYLGRPFEGWTNRKIEDELGEVHYYVHEKRNVPLIVADDDLSGTFTFLRAFADNGFPYDVTAEQIGNVWLNYLIEHRTVLWWGGMGNSTEHTAFLRLKQGLLPPRSGSAEVNGTVVSEQIGAQIFIDGWAMLCPGDPDKATALARKAASVSHDGEAIYGAQIIAAIEAMAFVESDIDRLLDSATGFIPHASTLYGLVEDLKAWKAAEPRDWRATLRKIEDRYGYDRFGGGCHMVPNHAVILLALLYGDGDFQKSLMIANTAGWDTDCNSGNVGCILGIRNGLAGIDSGVDWRGPVADRLYLPTADGGRCISDAVRETYAIVNTARALQSMKPLTPKHGMRFHFSLPGSVQGFIPEDSVECRGVVRLENAMVGQVGVDSGLAADERALAIHYKGVGPGRIARASTATFLPPDALSGGGYGLAGSPTLYSGQIVRARVLAADSNERAAKVSVYARVYGRDDCLEILRGDTIEVECGESGNLSWIVPDTDGRPVAEIGIEIGGHSGSGTILLDWLGWSGAPNTALDAPPKIGNGKAWKRAWVDASQRFEAWKRGDGKVYRLIHDAGDGFIFQGDSTWTNYTAAVTGSAHLADAFGLVVCARGLRRQIQLLLLPSGVARLVLVHDAEEKTLAEGTIEWALDKDFHLSATVCPDGKVAASIDDGENARFLEANIAPELASGAVGLLARSGNVVFGPVAIAPVPE